MTTFVFLGPSLPLPEAQRLLDAVYLPPVRQGDVYRVVALRRPSTIVIIDGYFNQVPAVWHKEILWALNSGVQVYGAASMGALRAVELSVFGMCGAGRIFWAYQHGVLPPYENELFEGDDEVAVTHGPAELGYLGLSEALVNIRVTLAAAATAGLIGADTRNELVRLAKNLFYPQRSYERVLAEARSHGLPEGEIAALERWLPDGRLDQKREDALQVLRLAGGNAAAESRASGRTFEFQHTVQWQSAVEAVLTHERPSSELLDELRLDASRYHAVRQQALTQLLGETDEVPGNDLPLAIRGVGEVTEDHRADAALTALHQRPDEIDAHWRRELHHREITTAIHSLPDSVLERHMLLLLRQSGEAQTLGERIGHKRGVLTALEFAPSAADLNGLQELQLRDWYFGRRLGTNIPEDLDAYLCDLGFADATAFNQALLCEYVYLEKTMTDTPP